MVSSVTSSHAREQALHPGDVGAALPGSTPNRSDLDSARRAATRYASRRNARSLHIWTRRGDGRRVQVLHLARADADLDDTDQL